MRLHIVSGMVDRKDSADDRWAGILEVPSHTAFLQAVTAAVGSALPLTTSSIDLVFEGVDVVRLMPALGAIAHYLGPFRGHITSVTFRGCPGVSDWYMNNWRQALRLQPGQVRLGNVIVGGTPGPASAHRSHAAGRHR
jgi:hypothetical protein